MKFPVGKSNFSPFPGENLLRGIRFSPPHNIKQAAPLKKSALLEINDKLCLGPVAYRVDPDLPHEGRKQLPHIFSRCSLGYFSSEGVQEESRGRFTNTHTSLQRRRILSPDGSGLLPDNWACVQPETVLSNYPERERRWGGPFISTVK